MPNGNGYHKVMRVEADGGFHSAIVEGIVSREYPMGQRTAGYESTPVFLFRDKGCAIDWANIRQGKRDQRGHALAILTGTAGNPRRQQEAACSFNLVRSILSFWRGSRHTERMSVPRGCYVADWFKPEELVWIKEVRR